MPQDKRTHFTDKEKDELLDPLRMDMANGMTDDQAATLTGIPLRSVQRWRLQHGLKRPRGFESKELADIYAISTLGEALGDVRHRVQHSPVSGTWEPPMFVVREHLDYSLFLRLIDAAHRVLGLSPSDISSAMGVSPRSVEQGLEIYTRHLNTTTKKCLMCESLVDPNVNSNFCTQLCEELYVRSR